MARYKLIALSNPVAGKEQEYNEWYSNVHLRDVRSLPGVKSARRFRLPLERPWRYAAEYEIECDDIAKWQADAQQALAAVVWSDAFDRSTLLTLYMEAL